MIARFGVSAGYHRSLCVLALWATMLRCAPPADQVVLADNVTILDDATARLAQVEEDRLLFPLADDEALLARTGGDILVSGYGMGWLRRVVSLETSGDAIIVRTEPAALTDVVAEGRADLAFDFPPAVASGDGIWGKQQSMLISCKLDPAKAIFPESGPTIRFTPEFRHELRLHVRFDIQRLKKLREAEVSLSGRLDVGLIAELEVARTLMVDLPSARCELPPVILQGAVPIPVPPFALPVTVAFKLTLESGGKVEARSAGYLEAGYRASARLSVGAKYSQGEWRTWSDPGLELGAIGPRWTRTFELRAKGYLRATGDVLLYGVVGPSAFVEGYLQHAMDLAAIPPPTCLMAGLTGKLGLKVDLFGAWKKDRYWTVLERSRRLFADPPNACGCEPEATKCEGPNVHTCQSDGSTWVSTQACASPGGCLD